jgi:predicted Holliday junction resolvase-like endonuclease
MDNFLYDDGLMTPLLLAFAAGAAIGAAACYFLMKEWIANRYNMLLERWKLESEKSIRARSLDTSRAVLKGKIGEQMAPMLPSFRHNPSDARFIGSPVDYIIFDGYSEAMSGQGRIRRIVFMDVKTGRAKLSHTEKKVMEAVRSGAVEWETLELD